MYIRARESLKRRARPVRISLSTDFDATMHAEISPPFLPIPSFFPRRTFHEIRARRAEAGEKCKRAELVTRSAAERLLNGFSFKILRSSPVRSDPIRYDTIRYDPDACRWPLRSAIKKKGSRDNARCLWWSRYLKSKALVVRYESRPPRYERAGERNANVSRNIEHPPRVVSPLFVAVYSRLFV